MGFGQQSVVFAWFLVHFYDFYPQWSNFPDLLILIIKLHYVVDCKTTKIVGQKIVREKKRKFFVEMRLFCNQSSPLQTCFKSPLMCIFFVANAYLDTMKGLSLDTLNSRVVGSCLIWSSNFYLNSLSKPRLSVLLKCTSNTHSFTSCKQKLSKRLSALYNS